MQVSHLKVFDNASEEEERQAEKLGYAYVLLSQAPSRAEFPVSYIGNLVQPAIWQESIKFYFDEDGRAVGYAIWAMLAPDVERRIIGGEDFTLHESEWNEGGSLWVVDLLAPHGHLQYILQDLRDNVFHGHKYVRYVRTRRNRRLVKEMERNERYSFFAEAVITS